MTTSFDFPGVALLAASGLFALLSVWGYALLFRGDESARMFARRCNLAFAVSVTGASVLLIHRLMTHDFRLAYVVGYTSRDLATHFLFSAFWAGQEGSFLLWLLCGAWMGLLLARGAREQEAPAMIVHLLAQGMILMLLFKQSPFKFNEGNVVPWDGNGLNPLLQDFWMVIHPPAMFVGYAACGIPFALALAGLWTRRYDSWVLRSFPWAHGAFVSLGMGNLLGGYWAYKTLGWGGYWGWDPVENASFVPWLTVTALLHGLYAQKAKGRYRRLNLLLAIATWGLILYGTFLTRSGVLADFSVHSFVDLGISAWLASVLLGTLAVALALFFWRIREIPAEPVSEPLFSRGVLVLLGIAVICGSAVVVLLGMSAPLITRFSDNPSQVSTTFYNVTNAPVAFLTALLVGIGPYLGWKGLGGRELARRAMVPALIGVAGAALAVFAGLRHPGWIAIVWAGTFGFASSSWILFRELKAGLFRETGGVLAHAGTGLLVVGIIVSSTMDRQEKLRLIAGQPVEIAGRALTFLQPVQVNENSTVMEIEVKDVSSGRTSIARPKFSINPRSQQLFANPSIQNRPLADLYIAPEQFSPGEGGMPHELSIAVTIKPLIQLVWFGFYIAMAGGLIALFHRRRESMAVAEAPVGILAPGEPADRADRPTPPEAMPVVS